MSNYYNSKKTKKPKISLKKESQVNHKDRSHIHHYKNFKVEKIFKILFV